MEITPSRCAWVTDDPLYLEYHDLEWGVPQHDNRRLFEMLTLEGAQAGLSWLTVLRKRAHYREVFDGFDSQKVAGYGAEKLESLLQDPGIIRNRLKVHGTVKNAQAFLKVQEEFGSFDRYIWGFVDGKPIHNSWASLQEVPAQTPESQRMSRDLKRRGFTFVGATITYAFMQATGMVFDHTTDCFCYTAAAETPVRK